MASNNTIDKRFLGGFDGRIVPVEEAPYMDIAKLIANIVRAPSKPARKRADKALITFIHDHLCRNDTPLEPKE